MEATSSALPECGREERKEMEERLTRLLRVCGHRVYHASPCSRTQTAALQVLAQAGPLSQKEMQNRLMVRSGSITELINKLESRGLVTRERDGADRRRVLLSITAAGRARLRHLQENAQPLAVYTALTDGELSTVVSLLGKVTTRWEEERTCAKSAPAPSENDSCNF